MKITIPPIALHGGQQPGVPAYAREELLAFPEADHDDCIDAMSCAWVGLQSATSGARVATRGTTTFGDASHALAAP